MKNERSEFFTSLLEREVCLREGREIVHDRGFFLDQDILAHALIVGVNAGFRDVKPPGVKPELACGKLFPNTGVGFQVFDLLEDISLREGVLT